MNEREASLRAKHAKELAALRLELDVIERLPPALQPTASVWPYPHGPMFGARGRLKVDRFDPALLPAEPLQRFRFGTFVSRLTAELPKQAVEDAAIGPVLVEVDEYLDDITPSYTARWLWDGWWVECPAQDRSHRLGARVIQRVRTSDRIPPRERAIVSCEWEPGTVPLRHVQRYGGGSPETPNRFVLQFEEAFGPAELFAALR